MSTPTTSAAAVRKYRHTAIPSSGSPPRSEKAGSLSAPSFSTSPASWKTSYRPKPALASLNTWCSRALRVQGQSLTMTELAITTNTLPARLSRVVARLEKDGYVRRSLSRGRPPRQHLPFAPRRRAEGAGGRTRPRERSTPPDFRPPDHRTG